MERGGATRYAQLDFEAGRAEEVKEYLAVLESADDGTWSAYVPDLPGCTSFGPSREEAARNIREAIRGHLEEMRETGERIPEPSSKPEIVHVA
ncbi:MAG TPA: type II toxin-antitoxin system HicB family antitoxin [Candidatus Cybelea sp.]|nr:type II toxin-antitoxin system HicB family antitoxin [Candidatus Cybelea sp.]